jgi:hypothetical protein
MFKIELTAMQLIRIIGLLQDASDQYSDMQNEARKDKAGKDISLAYFIISQNYKKCIASIEDQMKEQSK